MAIKIIYIARHGYRSNWLPEGPYPPPPTGVDSDVPLAAHGVEQAHELGNYMSSLHTQPELIFSSPFYRCLETSKPIFEELEVPVIVERGIGEWYKPDRPVIPEPASFEKLQSLFPGMLKTPWGTTVVPSSQGETEEEVFSRCGRFWPQFIQRVENQYPNVECIMLVTHAACKIALGMQLLRKQDVRAPINEQGDFIRSGSCSLDKFEMRATGRDEASENAESTADKHAPFAKREWVMTMNGNTEFLRAGEEMNWHFRDAIEAGSDADIQRRREAAAAAAAATETVYVSVDLPGSGRAHTAATVDTVGTLQCSGLGTSSPLLKIGDQLYEGDWKRLVGTELAFPEAAARQTKKPAAHSAHQSPAAAVLTPPARDSQHPPPDRGHKIYHIRDTLELHSLTPM